MFNLLNPYLSTAALQLVELHTSTASRDAVFVVPTSHDAWEAPASVEIFAATLHMAESNPVFVDMLDNNRWWAVRMHSNMFINGRSRLVHIYEPPLSLPQLAGDSQNQISVVY